MSGNGPLVFGATAVGDVISLFVPGGGVVAKLAEAYMQKRQEAARDLLVEELSNGYHGAIKINEGDVDELIAIILRVDRAVSSGIAMDNLRLLAQIIAGLKNKKAMTFDKFQRWCNVIENMTRDELMLVGFSCIVAAEHASDGRADGQYDFWDKVRLRMKNAGYERSEIASLAASVSRTGLLVPITALSEMSYGKTPWLSDLETLVDAKDITKTR